MHAHAVDTSNCADGFAEYDEAIARRRAWRWQGEGDRQADGAFRTR